MQKRSGLAECLAPLLLILGGCGRVASGTIAGIVTSPDNRRVPDAVVMVVSQDRSTSTGTRTNQSGNFATPALPVGRYTVFAQKEGFARCQMEIVVSQSGVARVDLHLAPLAPASVGDHR